jgi:hypothetical protein
MPARPFTGRACRAARSARPAYLEAAAEPHAVRQAHNLDSGAAQTFVLLQRESAVLMERAAIAKRISNEIDAQLKEDA